MNIRSNQGLVSAPKRDWTLLYVLDGDNDLREAASRDLVNLDQAGAPENTNIVAQLYRGELKWSLRNLAKKLKKSVPGSESVALAQDWRGMRTYEVRHQNSAESTVAVGASKNAGEISPSDPKSLKDIVSFAMKEYPAEHFAVILSGHGSQDGILSDSRGRKMDFEDVSSALQAASEETGEKVDVVLFDTCSTASDKTAAKMQGATDFLVASPSKIKGGGWSESATLNFLNSNPKATPSELAESFLSDQHTAVSDPVLYNLNP